MPTNLTIRIDDDLKNRLEDNAKKSGVRSVTEYIIQVLGRLLLESYDPFPFRPGPRVETDRNKTFADDRELLRNLSREADDPTVADDTDEARRTVFLTVPRALHIGAALSEYRSWEMLIEDFHDALNSNIVIKRLYIDRYRPEEWNDKDYAKLRKEDEEFLQRLLKENDKERLVRERKQIKLRKDRVFFKHVTVHGVMGSVGLEADHERLNDFNIYGRLAVSFTTATSYGLPFKCVLSQFPPDVDYWTRRFHDLWRDAEREEKKLRDAGIRKE